MDAVTKIHSTACIDDGASIGPGCNIWHWVHVCSGAVIGSGCTLGQNIFVSNKVKIGNNVKIQNNVSVYDCVTLEDNVFCGPSVVFTNVINPRAEVSRKNEYRQTIVGEGATLGANCTIICGVTVGRYAFVAAGAVLTRDAPAYALMMGVPAKQVGWLSEHGDRIDLPVQGEGTWICPYTKSHYRLYNGEISRIFQKKK